MTTTRVKLKLGLAEVELEGDHDNLHEEALRILDSMVDMVPNRPAAISQSEIAQPTESTLPVIETHSTPADCFDYSVDMIATHRKCNSSPELAIAACIQMHFSKGQHEFDRHEILEAMREATSFYKETMRGNLTQTLQSLVRGGALLSRASGKYALSNSTRTAAEATLAEIG